jgi:outer membrane protein TolC
MRIKLQITGLFLLMMPIVFGQKTITLKMCYDSAVSKYPLSRQFELLSTSNELKLKNIGKNYLPALMLNGQAHYQSDVTKIPVSDIPIPIDFPILDNDWYKISLDVSQTVYDGGTTSHLKDVEDVNLKIDKENIEIQLYALKERVTQIYFNILLLREGEKTLLLLKDNLTSKLSEVESGVANGAILASNADIIKAEIIDIEQKISETEIGTMALLESLNELTGFNLITETTLVVPNPEININTFKNNRLEYSLMTLQQTRLTAMKESVATKRMPHLSAFGQAGYGRPGYDMLNDQFDDFYMVGLRLNWNIWDWNHTRNEKKILDIQNDIVSTNKEAFNKNLRVELQSKIAEVRKYEEMIKRDNEIIKLRNKIVKAYSSQLDNGVITSTEYLTQVNEEAKATLNLKTHKIQLINAKLDYIAALGNL